MPVFGTGAVVRTLGGAHGFGETALARSDDGSFQIDGRALFEAGLTVFGTQYAGDALWVNTNGTLSFGAAFTSYSQSMPSGAYGDVIGAFWGDVDTRIDGEGGESGQVWIDFDTVNDVMSVTWADVGVYRYAAEMTNLFQLQIADRGGGDFDLTLRYERIGWHIGSAEDDIGAEAFWAGTRLPEAILLGDADSLATRAGNTGVLGLWYWEMRGGTVAGQTPVDGIVFSGTAGADVADGGALGDLFRGGPGNDTLRGNDGADWLYGEDGADTLNGGSGDDFIFGGRSEDDLRDVIFGGDGNDQIDAGYGNDLVYGGAGNDTIAGGFGVDELLGQDGNDQITGAAFSDLIFGGGGDDFLNGGFGYDRLNGGSGADRFFHLGIADHGSDWIQDYASAEGDLLVWGGGAASRADFQVNFADTANAGQTGVAEAFVIYRPSGQIIWALVDGAAQEAINLRVAGITYDLF